MRTNLRPTPESPRRGIGMIRVSKEGGRGERLLSPELQRASIEEHAARHGIDIVEWVEGVDESGSRTKSAWWPRLDRATERVERGEADVIVVWELSRTARNRLRWAVALDRVESAGGAIESATEPLDTTTAAGRFQRGVLAEMHAYKAEAIGEGWRDVHASRVRRGLPPGGKLPWGWRWDKGSGAISPDPEKAPFIVEAYRRYLAGAGNRDLADWLNRAGIPPMHSAEWYYTTVVQCLDSPIHAGLVTYNGETHPGAHEGIISLATWEAYRHERDRRAGEREVKRRYLLSGIALCPCTENGTPMNGFTIAKSSRNRGSRPRAPFVSYRCTTLGKSDGHGSWSMTARVVEGAVMDWLRDVAADIENLVPARAVQSDTSRMEAARLRKQRDELDLALTNLTVQLATGVVPETAYETARDQIAGRRAQLNAALTEAERLRASVPDDPSSLARGLLEDWEELPIDGRRAVLRQLVRGVVVDFEQRTARVWPVWEPVLPRG